MDLAANVKRVIVLMEHTSKSGETLLELAPGVTADEVIAKTSASVKLAETLRT